MKKTLKSSGDSIVKSNAPYEPRSRNLRREEILKRSREYYNEKFRQHGPTAQGTDWGSFESQQLRFRQLLRIIDEDQETFSINDYGCGYGALVDYMIEQSLDFSYYGLDLSEEMVAAGRALHADLPHCQFTTLETDLPLSDYTVASGIFNVKLDIPAAVWEAHVLETIFRIDAISARGFSFNILTIHSDADRMRPDLFYADPCLLFNHCKSRYSKWVAILHDYGLYEFTILVKKDRGRIWQK